MMARERKWKKKSQFLYCKQMSFDCIWNSKFYSLSLVTSQSGGRYHTIFSFRMFFFFCPFSLNSQWSCEEHLKWMGTHIEEELASQPANKPTSLLCFHYFWVFFDINAHNKPIGLKRRPSSTIKTKELTICFRHNATRCVFYLECACVYESGNGMWFLINNQFMPLRKKDPAEILSLIVFYLSLPFHSAFLFHNACTSLYILLAVFRHCCHILIMWKKK